MGSEKQRKKKDEWMIIEENIDMTNPFVFNDEKREEFYKKLFIERDEEYVLDDKVILVVDTNFVISHLSLISDLSKQCESYKYIIVFPWATIQELNGLKSSRNMYVSHTGEDIAFSVRKATDFIYKSLLQKENSIRGQKMTEVIDATLTGDDSILDCCRYWHEKRLLKTILLSNDKNLSIKVMIHGIYSISYEPGMTLELLLDEISKKLDHYLKHKNFDELQNIDMEIDDIQGDSFQSSESIDDCSFLRNTKQNLEFKEDLMYVDCIPLKDTPLSDECRTFLTELLQDITIIIIEASKILLKKHMVRVLGNDFSAEYLLKGCAFPPKRIDDLFHIIQKHWNTIFKELFKTHAYKERIIEMTKAYQLWSKWALSGIGIGPSPIQLLNWVEEIITFWKTLATVSTTDIVQDKEMQYKITLWRQQVKNLNEKIFKS
ncbi:hypothetical protein PNEG_03496 [Pneumocystis murina B123]|uniref:PIN domain-containing protein n=1 Tax=Pneumocystis murina (strain B123) TaxID=1069680 RepID=M7PC50_PNEMU|nr:hypothetical protein PNEG_03496 [Pneumocystis murina B123]EMR08054.1 hypothetical protein PNEG_03496 [Pneumocystis murina B123]